MQCTLTSVFIYYINKTLGTSPTSEILLFIPNNFSFSAIAILTATTSPDAPNYLESCFG